MNTRIAEEVLSDGSKAYNLVFVIDNCDVSIGCESEAAATCLQMSFEQNACHASIHMPPREDVQ